MSFKDRLALEASAGSGKTFALTVRYISLLLSGANPSNVVALTFTKKAACEMRERVYQTMQDLENREAELKELCDLLGKSEEDILQKKNDILPIFLKANIKISTIDAFFGYVLRKFALHLGLTPDFTSLASNNELKLQKLFLKKTKIKNAYDSFLRFAFISEKSLKDLFWILSAVYEKNSEIADLKFKRRLPPKEDNVLKIANQIKDELRNLGGTEKAMSTFETEDFAGLIKKNFWEKESLNYWEYKKVYTLKLDDMFFELKNALRDFYRQKESYWMGELFYLFDIYKSAKTALAKKTNELTFSDITNATYELLLNYVDSEFLYFRLDSVIEHLLIDEFQDTNIVQYKILEPIVKEIQAGVGTKEFKSFFYVGDTKQSIYRFRGGAKALFSHAAETFGMQVDSLTANYRSKKEIVEFVNETFKDKIVGYKPQIAKKEGGFVKVLKKSDSDSAIDGIISSIQMLMDEGVKPESIAILCSTNKDAQIIQEAILEKLPSVCVQTESTSLLISSHSVSMILEFLKYLYFKDALFGRNFQALRGADFEELPSLEGFSIHDTPLTLITFCIKRFELESDTDTLLFLEIALKYDDLESLLFSYEDIKDVSAKASFEGLKILTVHKSKGLEFSCVIVSDSLRKSYSGGDLLLFDYDSVELKNIYINFSKREFVDEDYKKAKSKEKILEEEDRLNQTYVAFTRAKNALIVVVKEKNSLFENLNLVDFSAGVVNADNKEIDKTIPKKAIFEGRTFGAQNIVGNESKIEGNFDDVNFGLALHFTLEMMSSFNDIELENALNFTKNRYGYLLENMAFDSIKKRVLALISNENFIALTSGGKIYKEQPYTFEGKQKQIDIMVEYADKIVIIDYKSSRLAQVSHIEQVQEYKNAIEIICKKSAEGYLCYLHEDKTEIVRL